MPSAARRHHHLVHMILGLVILLGVVAWGILAATGDRVLALVDIPSAIWVGGVLTGGLWLSFGPMRVLRAFAALFSADETIIPEAYAIYLLVFTRAYQLAWGAGLVGLLLGVVLMLLNLDDPSRIGPGMAVALLPALYGALLAEFLFAPLRQVLANRVIEREVDLPIAVAPYRSVAGIAVAVAFAVLSIVLLLTMTTLHR